MLVLYFSASAILYIPRLRSLWSIPEVYAPRAIWTVLVIATVLVICTESARKTRSLRPSYRGVSIEQSAGFWGRSFFIWTLPFFRSGYSKNLQLEDVPQIDPDLAEKAVWTDLDASWHRCLGSHRLLRATFAANLCVFLSAIVPRLAWAGFKLCQPFLIESAVSYLNEEPGRNRQMYSQTLVVVFILVYLGIAVSR